MTEHSLIDKIQKSFSTQAGNFENRATELQRLQKDWRNWGSKISVVL